MSQQRDRLLLSLLPTTPYMVSNRSLSHLAAVGVVLTSLLVVGCGRYGGAHAVAEDAVRQFHRDLDLARYGSIWSEASPDLRGAIPQESFFELLKNVHTTLGQVRDSTTATWEANTIDGVVIVAITRETTFEKGTGIESFSFRFDGRVAQLASYDISSGDLAAGQ